MKMKNKEKLKAKVIVVVGIISFLLLFAYLTWANLNSDDGEYNYCIEWEGLNSGILHRDSLLYTCYSLATSEFKCDYEVQDDGSLMVKPILNTTKGKDGFLTSITYGDSNYFNCTRWLKSK